MRPKPSIPSEIEDYRDETWCREGARAISSVIAAERFIEQVGFAACMTDSRRPGPSLYVAVCGRRDAVLPRHVQKDPETSLTWTLKDQLLRRGKVYYAKHARAVLNVLRHEWEMASIDLRKESGVSDRTAFTRALDELQAAMVVIPSEAVYLPKFTYLWTLAVSRFPDDLMQRVDRDVALREIARAFLGRAGQTIPGELARVAGLSRPEAGRGNRALVAEGYATMSAPGFYELASEVAVNSPLAASLGR